MSQPATPPRPPDCGRTALASHGLGLRLPTLLLAACTGSPATPRTGRRTTGQRTPGHRTTLRRPAHRHRPRKPDLPRRSTRRPGAPVDPHPHHVRSGSTHQRRPHRPAHRRRRHHPRALRRRLRRQVLRGQLGRPDDPPHRPAAHPAEGTPDPGTHPIGELATAGTATTLDGTTVTITRTGPTARLGDRADAVCADYQATNARIHIINAVLGPLPTTADDTDHRAH